MSVFSVSKILEWLDKRGKISYLIFAAAFVLISAIIPAWGNRPARDRLDPSLKLLLRSRGISLGIQKGKAVVTPARLSKSKPRNGGVDHPSKPGKPAIQPPLWHTFKKHDGIEMVSVLIRSDATETTRAVSAAGGRVIRTAGSIIAAEVPVSVLPVLADTPGIRYIKAPATGHPMTDVSTVETHAREVTQYLDYKGRNVLIGIVDSGIDWRQPDFINPDGTSRIISIWDQTDNAGPPPENFSYGTEYTKAQIDAALAGSGSVDEMDTLGHGTHVLGIAAANGRSGGGFIGMAPEAGVIVVKTDWTSMLDGNSYILQKAAQLNMPVVINNSWGTQLGPHNGRSLDSAYLNSLVENSSGRAIVFAAGNEGNDNIHVHGNADNTSGYFKVRANTQEIRIDIWSGVSTVLETGVSFFAGYNQFNQPMYATVTAQPGELLNYVVSGQETPNSPYIGSDIMIDASGVPYPDDPATNHYFIRIAVQGSSTAPWRVVLKAHNGQGGAFDAWVASTGCDVDNENDGEVRYFGDHLKTVAEPGCGEHLFSVSSYITKNQWIDIDGNTQTDPYLPHDLGAISIYSSHGPINGSIQKPDLAAPGEMIVSSLSSDTNPLPSRSKLIPGGKHLILHGTSMAAPHVAGAIALLLEKNPNLSNSQIKDLINSNARADAATGAVPNTAWGWGKLDVLAALDAAPPAAPDTTPPNVPVVTDDGQYTYAIGMLHAAWRAYDRDSGIAEYEYAIGTQSGLNDVVDWTDAGLATSVTRQDLNLVYGTTYYFSVRARNHANLWSGPGCSDGIIFLQDTTAPSTPVVTDEGNVTRRTTELNVTWSSGDPESGIAEYQYAIGSSPTTTDIRDWTSAGLATSVKATGLSLVLGNTYYIHVKALNRANLWSSVGTSDGIRVDTTSSVLANTAWPMYRRNAAHSGWSPRNAAQEGILQWSVSYAGSYAATSLAVGQDGVIYLGGGGANNKVYALDPATGGLRYAPFSAQSGASVLATPCIAEDGIIYIGATDGYLYALNRDLTLFGSVNLGQPIHASAAIGPDGTIYVASTNGKLYAFQPDLIQKWEPFQTGGSIESSPAVGPDGTIYAGSGDGSLYAINPDGTQKWRFDTAYQNPPPMRSSPALSPDGSVVYIGSDDFNVYAVDASTGDKLWHFSTGGKVYSSPAVGPDGTVYVGSESTGVYAINPTDGSARWVRFLSSPVQSSPVLGRDSVVYIGCTNGSMYALRPSNGTILWSYQTGSEIWSAPAIGSLGQVYVLSDGIGSETGRVYAFSSSQVFTSPTDFISYGWNLVGLPAYPMDPDPVVVFSGVDVPNSSFQFWNNNILGGGYISYGTEWTGPVQVGLPYWFMDLTGHKTLQFRGYALTTDQQIVFPGDGTPHWVMFSHPFAHATSCNQVLFATSSDPYSVDWETAYNNSIVASSAIGFEPATSSFFSAGIPDFMTERHELQPWYGYWLLVYSPEDVIMTIPAQ